jgi:hypothetical protein
VEVHPGKSCASDGIQSLFVEKANSLHSVCRLGYREAWYVLCTSNEVHFQVSGNDGPRDNAKLVIWL